MIFLIYKYYYQLKVLNYKFNSILTNNTLFTIDYEGLNVEKYINKLFKKNIKIVVDIRKNAYSNKFGFTKKEFQYCLEKSGIKYIHISELGIESEKRQKLKVGSCKENSPLFGIDKNLQQLFEDYKNNLSSKQKYIDQLLEILKQDKLVAITCFEADYKCCHRGVLSEYLQGFNKNIEIMNL